MANDFSGDANCVALWRHESGALSTDSKSTHTLTNNDVTADTSSYREGSAAGVYTSLWTEVDPGADITLTDAAITFTSLNTRNSTSYVYRHFGKDYFSGDFTHKFVVNISSLDAEAYVFPWQIANEVATAWTADPAVRMEARNLSGTRTFRLRGYGSAAPVWSAEDVSVAFSLSTDYYVTLTRDDDGGASSTGRYVATICTGNFSGEAGSSAFDTLTVDAPVGGQLDWSYLYHLNTAPGSTSKYASGSVSSCSVDGVTTNFGGQTQSIADADLTAAMPFKNGGSETNISVCCWFYASGVPYQNIVQENKPLLTKWNMGVTSEKVFGLFLTGTGTQASVSVQHGNEGLTHGSAILAGRWYHVGVTYNATTKAATIRVWDQTAGAILGSDASGSYTTTVGATTSPYVLGTWTGGSYLAGYSGLLDEVVVFNDILTTDEIDAIRSGTYGAAASPSASLSSSPSASRSSSPSASLSASPSASVSQSPSTSASGAPVARRRGSFLGCHF